MPPEVSAYIPKTQRRSPMMRSLDREASPFHQAVDFVRRAIRGIGQEGFETIGGLIVLAAAAGVFVHAIQSEPDALHLLLDEQIEVAPRDLSTVSDD